MRLRSGRAHPILPEAFRVTSVEEPAARHRCKRNHQTPQKRRQGSGQHGAEARQEQVESPRGAIDRRHTQPGGCRAPLSRLKPRCPAALNEWRRGGAQAQRNSEGGGLAQPRARTAARPRETPCPHHHRHLLRRLRGFPSSIRHPHSTSAVTGSRPSTKRSAPGWTRGLRRARSWLTSVTTNSAGPLSCGRPCTERMSGLRRSCRTAT